MRLVTHQLVAPHITIQCCSAQQAACDAAVRDSRLQQVHRRQHLVALSGQLGVLQDVALEAARCTSWQVATIMTKSGMQLSSPTTHLIFQQDAATSRLKLEGAEPCEAGQPPDLSQNH